MSDKGIYTALSGAIAQSSRLDTIANNIANVNTPAFKRDQQVFKEYLSAWEKKPDVIQVPKVPASIESFYDMQGGDKAFVDSAGTFTDFSQGTVKATGNPLDVAIEGKGFIEVLAGGKIKYTRNGALKVDNEGRLVTKEGFQVLRAATDDSADPSTRIIQLKGGKIAVGSNGEIFEDGVEAGRMSLVNIEPQDGLQKTGSSLYTLRENFRPQIDRNPQVQLHQGFLEASNVEIVREMTDMISATRTFESTQRAIKAYDELADKLVNVVPRVD